MDMSIDVKCAVTTAILSVLVYLLLVNLLSRVWTQPDELGKSTVGKEMNDTEWFKSMEVIMLVAVFIAFNLNNVFYTSCKSA
jgi:hypothetical protein